MQDRKYFGNYYVRIGQVANVYRGYRSLRQERKQEGKYLLLGRPNIIEGHLVTTKKDTYTDYIAKETFRRAIAQPGDIIFSRLFDRRKTYVYRRSDPQAVVLDSCGIIRVHAIFEGGDYILSYLRSIIRGQGQFLDDAEQAAGWAFIQRLSIRDLEAIKIPLLPISDVQRLGDAHIELSTTHELTSLRNELKSKENEVTELKALNDYLEDRILKIEDEKSSKEYALKNRMAHGETSTLELKSSLRWNFKTKEKDKNLEYAVCKEIVAFCNSNGGELLIGVDDNKTIIGVQNDNFKNTDEYLLHLGNLIQHKIIPRAVVQYIKCEMVTIDGIDICRVVCRQSKEDVWFKQDQNTPEKFYVRIGPSSRELPPRDAHQYIQERFPKGHESAPENN